MDDLMNLEAVHLDRHLRDLHKLYDCAEINIYSLQLLGIEADTYESLLSPVLLDKLLPELHLIVSRKATDSGLAMDILLRFSSPSSRHEKEPTLTLQRSHWIKEYHPQPVRCSLVHVSQNMTPRVHIVNNLICLQIVPQCCRLRHERPF